MYGVDLERYPIDRLDSPEGQALVARCQADMVARGVSQLPGFLTPLAIGEILATARQLSPQGWASESTHNVYFTPLAEASPHSSDSMPQRSAKRAIAYDLLPVLGVLKGDHGAVETLPSAPGTLALFHGYHAMHRVTAVQGSRPRINTVLTYGEQPDMTLSPLTQKLFYGRNVPSPNE